jgi:hypothetical protein
MKTLTPDPLHVLLSKTKTRKRNETNNKKKQRTNTKRVVVIREMERMRD